jgi:hypothetical protein
MKGSGHHGGTGPQTFAASTGLSGQSSNLALGEWWQLCWVYREHIVVKEALFYWKGGNTSWHQLQSVAWMFSAATKDENNFGSNVFEFLRENRAAGYEFSPIPVAEGWRAATSGLLLVSRALEAIDLRD